jgi:putative protease
MFDLLQNLRKTQLPSTKPELICPVGNWPALREVVPYADAVYFGAADSLNMRQRAENFEYSELGEVINFCKDHSVKTYFTLNTIVYDDELVELHQAIELVKSLGIDAIICHDQASIQICRHLGVPFHVSTQANVTNKLSAKFYEALGAKMIILSRELSLGQVAEITKSLDTARTEIFIHGAICSMVSGRCFFSVEETEYSREFSSNKGACIQPCRRMFWICDDQGIKFETDGQRFFNSKDLCMIEHMDLIVATRVGGLKIEGRIRDPRYCRVTAQVYREALDAVFDLTYTEDKIKKWKSQLESVFNRGFHTGFYFDTPKVEDHNRNLQGNASKLEKKLFGTIENYYPNIEVATIKATSGILKTNQEILIESPKKNKEATYFSQIIKSIQIDGKTVDETPMASSESHQIITVKVNKPVKKGDFVYIFQPRTE